MFFFYFEKDSNDQNWGEIIFPPPNKKVPPAKFPIAPKDPRFFLKSKF